MGLVAGSQSLPGIKNFDPRHVLMFNPSISGVAKALTLGSNAIKHVSLVRV